MMKCPNCEETIEENDKYCFKCGTKLSDYKKCFNCGSLVLKTDKYCIFCGVSQASTNNPPKVREENNVLPKRNQSEQDSFNKKRASTVSALKPWMVAALIVAFMSYLFITFFNSIDSAGASYSNNNSGPTVQQIEHPQESANNKEFYKRVIISSVEVKDNPVVDAKTLSYLNSGAVVTVLHEFKETSGIVWYQISNNGYFWDDGTRSKIYEDTTENKTQSKENTADKEEVLYKIEITDLGNNVKIRSTPEALKDNSNKIGNVKTGEIYNVYEELAASDLTWYRIGENRWISDGGGWVHRINDD